MANEIIKNEELNNFSAATKFHHSIVEYSQNITSFEQFMLTYAKQFERSHTQIRKSYQNLIDATEIFRTYKIKYIQIS